MLCNLYQTNCANNPSYIHDLGHECMFVDGAERPRSQRVQSHETRLALPWRQHDCGGLLYDGKTKFYCSHMFTGKVVRYASISQVFIVCFFCFFVHRILSHFYWGGSMFSTSCLHTASATLLNPLMAASALKV